jgi:hypothetical protein
MKKRRALSSIGIISVFATCGAENIFTAAILMSVALSCLYFGKAFSEETWG